MVGLVWPEIAEIPTMVSSQIIDDVLVSSPLLLQLQLRVPALTVQEVVRAGEAALVSP